MNDRMLALKRANDVRLAKAQVRNEIKNGERTFASLLDEVPECCAKLPVFELLQWCPRVGHSRAQKLTKGVLSETLPLRFLRGQTRLELSERLRDGGVT